MRSVEEYIICDFLAVVNERKIQAFETKCLRKLLHISYTEHKIYDYVWSIVKNLVGPQKPLLATIRRWKLAWFGHVMWHDSLSKTITQGTVKGRWRHGQQKKSWFDNTKDWTQMTLSDLLSMTANRKAWRMSASLALRSP